MGLIPLITWAVIDSVMKIVINEMQGFSIVEMRASSLAFWRYRFVGGRLHTLLDAGFEPCKTRASSPAFYHRSEAEMRASNFAS